MIVENLKVTQTILSLCKELISKNYETEFYEFAIGLCNDVFIKFAQ